MSIHINEVLDYLDAHPIRYYNGRIQSLMEMLYDVYAEYNCVESQEIQELLQAYDHLLEALPRSIKDELWTLSCNLCREHEVVAFSHGIVVGMHLMTELNSLL